MIPYRLNPDTLGEVFAVPAAVVDDHIRLAGSAQLKVLLWLLRNGQGVFDPEKCAGSIGLSAADCRDAAQYWLETGVLLPAEKTETASPAPEAARTEQTAPAAPIPEAPSRPTVPAARPRPVKPTMKEVVARQKGSPGFAYLLDTASARLGRPVSQGDMETLLYLFDTAGLPAEVILMVIEYAVSMGKYNMRYIEKVALDWADRGIDTIAAAEETLCGLERRREAWERVATALGLTQKPRVADSDAAERWIFEWKTSDDLLRLAYERCREATGGFRASYIDKILEGWRLDGIDTLEKALKDRAPARRGKGKTKEKKETSFDLEQYETMVTEYTPVYKR